MDMESSTKIKINNEYITVNLNDPLEWKYIAEGHKHAVFSLQSTKLFLSEQTKHQRERTNIVLRIPKSNTRGGVDCTNRNDNSSICDINVNKEYLENAIIKCVGEQYIDKPHKVILSYNFVCNLAKEAMKIIPKSRIDSWKILHEYEAKCFSDGTNNTTTTCVIHATIQIDYRVLVLNNNNKLLSSVEIKPKAGYVACTPLVHPKHRYIKMYSTRYSIIQRLLKHNLIKRGWVMMTDNNNNISSSRYCPLDLYSNNIHRMKCSIQSLFNNPQNNLKIWYNHNNSNSNNNKDRNNSNEKILIQEIMLQILKQEPILQTIQKLQECNDFLDVDGIILVYKRLLLLCNYNYNLLESYCDDYKNMNFICFTNMNDYKNKTIPSCPALIELLDKVTNFKEKYMKINTTTTTSCKELWITQNQSMLDYEYNQCINKIIPKLNKQACVFLIQHWLLSLTMSDISLFITISQHHSENNQNNKLQDANGSNGFIALKEKEKENDDINNCFEYFIKIIDYDPKPSSKLHKREEMENLIQLL